ncbi:hypothetical protein NMY22_g9287 [Coprinellus aureogranulatus]|nr:hypothetical protein NMY22_g9287 [Coprinellus aureogranulatus]
MKDLTARLHQQDQFPFVLGEHSDLFRVRKVSDSTPKPRLFVVKTLRAGSSSNPNFYSDLQKKLVRRGDALAQLDHENISTDFGIIYGMGLLPGIVMDYYEGGSIIALMSAEVHTDEEKMLWVGQIACGMRYLHSRRFPVVHGNLKGSNIFLTTSGKIVIADVGMAYITNTSEFMIHETAAGARWAAPELLDPNLASKPSAAAGTTQSDVFAFAMTIIEIFSQELPYSHITSATAVVFAILRNERPQLPRYVEDHTALSSLVKGCWARLGQTTYQGCHRVSIVARPIPIPYANGFQHEIVQSSARQYSRRCRRMTHQTGTWSYLEPLASASLDSIAKPRGDQRAPHFSQAYGAPPRQQPASHGGARSDPLCKQTSTDSEVGMGHSSFFRAVERGLNVPLDTRRLTAGNTTRASTSDELPVTAKGERTVGGEEDDMKDIVSDRAASISPLSSMMDPAADREVLLLTEALGYPNWAARESMGLLDCGLGERRILRGPWRIGLKEENRAASKGDRPLGRPLRDLAVDPDTESFFMNSSTIMCEVGTALRQDTNMKHGDINPYDFLPFVPQSMEIGEVVQTLPDSSYHYWSDVIFLAQGAGLFYVHEIIMGKKQSLLSANANTIMKTAVVIQSSTVISCEIMSGLSFYVLLQEKRKALSRPTLLGKFIDKFLRMVVRRVGIVCLFTILGVLMYFAQPATYIFTTFLYAVTHVYVASLMCCLNARVYYQHLVSGYSRIAHRQEYGFYESLVVDAGMYGMRPCAHGFLPSSSPPPSSVAGVQTHGRVVSGALPEPEGEEETISARTLHDLSGNLEIDLGDIKFPHPHAV